MEQPRSETFGLLLQKRPCRECFAASTTPTRYEARRNVELLRSEEAQRDLCRAQSMHQSGPTTPSIQPKKARAEFLDEALQITRKAKAETKTCKSNQRGDVGQCESETPETRAATTPPSAKGWRKGAGGCCKSHLEIIRLHAANLTRYMSYDTHEYVTDQ